MAENFYVERLETANAKIERLRATLSQILARANSLQNGNSHTECLRQLSCIDRLARKAGVNLLVQEIDEVKE